MKQQNFEVTTVKIGESELEVKYSIHPGDESTGLRRHYEIISVKIYETPQTKIWKEKFKDFSDGGEWENYTIKMLSDMLYWSNEFDCMELEKLFLDDFSDEKFIYIDKKMVNASLSIRKVLESKEPVLELKKAIEKIYDFVTIGVHEIEVSEYCDIAQIEQLLKDQED